MTHFLVSVIGEKKNTQLRHLDVDFRDWDQFKSMQMIAAYYIWRTKR